MSASATPPSRWRLRLAVLLLCAVVLTLGIASVVTVGEGEVVLIERLGNLIAVYDTDDERGLRFKLPWPIDRPQRFDARVQLLDPPGREMFTRDRKNIVVDAYLCWQIAESESDAETVSPTVRFYRGLGSHEVAASRLESRLRSQLTAAIGQRDLDDLLSGSTTKRDPVNETTEDVPALITLGEVLTESLNTIDAETTLTDELGLRVLEVRIERVSLPVGNHQAVYERMRSERRKIAERYRASGEAEDLLIRSRADRRAAELLAKAKAEATRIRGEAEADAITLLNRVRQSDPELAEFLRTLEAYRTLLGERTTLVLSATGPLWQLLRGGDQLDGQDTGEDVAEPDPPSNGEGE